MPGLDAPRKAPSPSPNYTDRVKILRNEGFSDDTIAVLLHMPVDEVHHCSLDKHYAPALFTDTASEGGGDIPGPQGPTGPQGPKGNTGNTGPAGPEGPEGPMGPRGYKGDDGEDGAAGPKGDTGAQGPAGAAGAQGPAGPQGAKGNTGAQGPPGQSANLLQYTFVLTYTEPPTGNQIRVNNANFAQVTKIWVRNLTVDGMDVKNLLNLVVPGDRLTLQDKDESARIQRYNATATPVAKTDYMEFAVEWVSGDQPLVQQQCLLAVIWSAPPIEE